MRLRLAGRLTFPAAALAAAACLVPVSGAASAAPSAPAARHIVAAPAKAPVSSSDSIPVTGYTVTLVARKCSSYSDIMANKVRNNIMESLQDLGKDSVYQNGQAVNPATEQANDPACTPLNGWQFEVGSSYTKPGQLSVVTGSPLVTTGVTRTIPELSAQGRPTGKLISGAVVYKVSGQQYQLAQQSALWVQGGTVQYPQLANKYGATYAFGVLRCAVDNANADNVESAVFPSGTKNVFCYAYYVDPAPAAATVTIRKDVAGSGVSQGFTFNSNLSYDPSGTFALQVNNGSAASTDFVRAASASFGGPYNVTEQVPAGWQLTGLTCTDTTGASTWTTNLATAATAITLGAGDHVTCTYTDAPPAPRSLTQLSVWKVTSGGSGGPFSFAVAGPVSHNLTATTAASERPVEATENGTNPANYTAGDYTITEKLPAATRAGSWRFLEAYCNARSVPAKVTGASVSVAVTLGTMGQVCVFRNQFVPAGQLIVLLRTIGGTAAGVFLGLGPADSRYGIFKAATKRSSVPVTIYDKSHLPFGTWLAYSVTPKSDPARGTWVFNSFTCTQGSTTQPAQQARVITLSAAHPVAVCLATYHFQAATEVELTKTASGAAGIRTGPSVVKIQCLSTVDKTLLAKGQVVLARNAARASLPHPLILEEPATCTVTESAIGTASTLNWTGSAALNGHKLSLPGSFTVSGPSAHPLYQVVVHNAYHDAVVPCGSGAGAARLRPAC